MVGLRLLAALFAIWGMSSPALAARRAQNDELDVFSLDATSTAEGGISSVSAEIRSDQNDAVDEDVGEAARWVNTQAAPDVPLSDLTAGSVKLVPGTWMNPAFNDTLGEGVTQPEGSDILANNSRLAMVYYYAGTGCSGDPIWSMEQKEKCRSEPLTQGGELRIKLCASSAAEIISNDDAVIRLIRPGCHSTLLEKAVVQYNERCVKGLFCQGCKTCPESICLRQGSQCKLDGEFDPVFYADKYGNETDVSNIKTDNDKLVNHWTQHGAANRWVGCQGCCPGKAYVPNCAFTVVGCSDAQQSIALDLKDTYARDK